MVKHSARHKPEDTQALEQKLKEGGEILNFGPPLATQTAITERMAEALTTADPATRSDMLDRLFHATLGQLSTGFSPAALLLAYTDWAAHLSISPNRQAQLVRDGQRRWLDLCLQAFRHLSGEKEACCPTDRRFKERYQHEGWKRWPYNILASAHLSTEDWWEEASRIRGMTQHHQTMVAFMHLLFGSALSPENQVFLNPALGEKIFAERGMNFWKGASNALEDMQRWWGNKPPVGTDAFEVGKDVAASEGKVIFRNALFELIQYTPQTKNTYPEPLLIIPAWIMKYYILDLSPHNSMVRYLVGQGHTVFMISWKNPDARYRDVGFIDYLKEGALQALDVVQEIFPDRQVHAVGYCIGGTLLAMLAAYLSNLSRNALATVTLFAAQTDFTEAGELMTFIDDSQVSYLEDIMFSQGFLRGGQISAAFNLLKPRELIWSHITKEYVMGERDKPYDLMAWDEDTTRLPYRMHTEYLRHLYLRNELVEGEFEIDGQALDLHCIEMPMFVVSTEHDHIAPWKSVYKIHLLANAEITFVLANKGHNGGIVSEPGHKGREYRIGVYKPGAGYMPPGKWMKSHEPNPGSWWQAWHKWLAAHSAKMNEPPAMGSQKFKPLEDAPGTYVHEH